MHIGNDLTTWIEHGAQERRESEDAFISRIVHRPHIFVSPHDVARTGSGGVDGMMNTLRLVLILVVLLAMLYI